MSTTVQSLDDMLGPSLDDMLGPAKRKKYQRLPKPRTPLADGIFAVREKKGQNLGRTCMFCNDKLKFKKGRPPVICEKKSCFRKYRNAYRAEYDRAHPNKVRAFAQDGYNSTRAGAK